MPYLEEALATPSVTRLTVYLDWQSVSAAAAVQSAAAKSLLMVMVYALRFCHRGIWVHFPPGGKSDSYRISAITVQFSLARIAFPSLSGKIASCHRRRRRRNKPTTLSLSATVFARSDVDVLCHERQEKLECSSSSDRQCATPAAAHVFLLALASVAAVMISLRTELRATERERHPVCPASCLPANHAHLAAPEAAITTRALAKWADEGELITFF